MPAGTGFNKILFEHVSTVWSVHGYYVIRLPLSVKSLHQECQNLKHALVNFNFQLKSPDFKHELALVHGYVRDACAAEQLWPTRTTRPRRQALLAAAALFLGSDLILNVVDHFRHDALLSRVDDLQNTVHQLSTVLRRELTRQREEELAREHVLLLTTHARAFHYHVMDFTQGLLHVQHQHRLPPALLSPLQALTLWTDFHEHVEIALPYEAPALFAVHAELRTLQHELVVDVFLPVPDRILHLYMYKPFPVQLNNTLLVPTLPVGTLFAIDQVHQDFRVTTSEELEACIVVGRAQFCPFAFIQHDFARQCLPALFLGHWTVATSACLLETAAAPWYLAKAGRGWWYLFASEKIMYTISCANHSRTSDVWHPGFSHFHVNEDCDLTCSLFSIPRHLQEIYQAEAVEKIFPTDLFMRTKLPEVELPDPGSVLVQAHPVSLATTGLLTIVVTAMFAACCCILYYWRKDLRTRPSPPAPSPPPGT